MPDDGGAARPRGARPRPLPGPQPAPPVHRHLYGGQVAAQALRAAAMTVPEGRSPALVARLLPAVGRGRPPHDHAGEPRPRRPLVLGPPRGRAAAGQGDLHRVGVVPRRRGERRLLRRPVPRRRPGARRRSPTRHRATRMSWTMRPVDPTPRDDPGRVGARRAASGRARASRLSDDRVLHACRVVYLSDMSTGFAELDVPGLPRGGSSLDHTVLLPPSRARRRLAVHGARAGVGRRRARGVYRGSIHDRTGRLRRHAGAGEPDAPPPPSATEDGSRRAPM